MEIISKVSKGSKMDQIYLPKQRSGMSPGSYVVIKPLETKESEINPIYYNTKDIEPIKAGVIKEIFKKIEANLENDNIIISGSFLEPRFNFNDIDVIVVSNKKSDKKYLEELLKANLGIKTHIIIINQNSLANGYATDPLFRLMLSKSAAKKRLIFNKNPKINYKILDLHLLRSNLLLENFDLLTGDEKYKLIRNLIAIRLFTLKKEISKEIVDKNINSFFGKKSVYKIKQNMIEKKEFLKKYKTLYISTQKRIFKGIKHDSKQK